MPKALVLPAEVVRGLPPGTELRLVVGRREPEARPQIQELSDCVKAILARSKLPVVKPATPVEQSAWLRAYVAATGDCYQRFVRGQMRATTPGVVGALVPPAKTPIRPKRAARKR